MERVAGCRFREPGGRPGPGFGAAVRLGSVRRCYGIRETDPGWDSPAGGCGALIALPSCSTVTSSTLMRRPLRTVLVLTSIRASGADLNMSIVSRVQMRTSAPG